MFGEEEIGGAKVRESVYDRVRCEVWCDVGVESANEARSSLVESRGYFRRTITTN